MYKTYLLTTIIILTTLCGCNRSGSQSKEKANSYQPVDTVYYKNQITNEIIGDANIRDFIDSLRNEYADSIFGPAEVTLCINDKTAKDDSLILHFSYDIRVGLDYPVRTREYPKTGMLLPPRKFRTLDNDSIQIGGIQDKPMLINLWFLGCRGCIEEIPVLNRLQEKYADKVNFIAMTFDEANEVSDFLSKTDFSFRHIASDNWKDKNGNIRPYINTIASYPYPENIFIGKEGKIRYIEAGLYNSGNWKQDIKHFEMIIQDLLAN